MSKKVNRKSQLTSVSDVLQTLLQNGKSPLSQGFSRWRVWRDWNRIVGEEVARHTVPVDYKQGMLYLWVNSSARMQEISFMSQQIRRRVNEHMGRNWVSRIRFTLNKNDIPSQQELEQKLSSLLEKKP